MNKRKIVSRRNGDGEFDHMLILKAFIGSLPLNQASQVVLVVKNPPANSGDAKDEGLIPGSGRSPGVGNSNTLQ